MLIMFLIADRTIVGWLNKNYISHKNTTCKDVQVVFFYVNICYLVTDFLSLIALKTGIAYTQAIDTKSKN